VSQTFVGPLVEASLERMSFDRRAFLGADTVTAKDGICEADHAQTRLKELMARHWGFETWRPAMYRSPPRVRTIH
jgi:DeoR/GlpR family transcriptional regulator of sugar metabolism